ncbi:MAG: T9SS type A sorting domain-containing protein [Bacteroidetes bacterium]|nr:T9SS type A sorting domain-containing protein [Bacteroidota bacterium]
MARFYFFLLHFFILSSLFAQTQLTVSDPQSWWGGGQGTIEESVISINPLGIYSEIGMYLTFSAKSLNYHHSDTLEVVLDFDLPAEAIITDLWLWVGDSIVKAQMLDKWSASDIYENIVNRRKDPAILFKKQQGHFQLRIFPMAGDESRKIKLNYLIPNQWLNEKVAVTLPANILRTSKHSIPIIELIYSPREEWKNPRVIEQPDYEFTEVVDEDQHMVYHTLLPNQSVYSSLNVSFDSPMKNGIYFKYFEEDGEGIYQLAFNPSAALNLFSYKKVAFMIDYDESKTTITKEEVINTLKAKILNEFTANDSFNVFYSKLDVKEFSSAWISADSLNVSNYFNDLKLSGVANYSNLPAVLNRGIEFIKNNGNEGSLFLISSSDQFGDYSPANTLLNDLKEKSENKIPISIADITDKNYQYYWFGARSYYGNEYFYLNLSRLTGGEYERLLNYSYLYGEILDRLFSSLNGFIRSFDMHTKMESGFCYARYNYEDDPAAYINKPILQVGKFFGGFPFLVEASGIYDSQAFSLSVNVNNNDFYAGDSTVNQLWAGNHIRNLEMTGSGNDGISEIISYSMQERVLSLYTAFLALEPGMSYTCADCYNDDDGGGIITDVEDTEEAADSMFIVAYPNPFNAQTEITVNLSKDFEINSAVFKVYNVLGQEIKTFENNFSGSGRNLKFNWDGRNDNGGMTSSGIYFFVAANSFERHTLKLLMLK